MKQHKWHKEIKAWADGQEIECRYLLDEEPKWDIAQNPNWLDSFEYRIKPQPQEPLYMYVLREHGKSDFWISPFPASAKNVKTIA